MRSFKTGVGWWRARRGDAAAVLVIVGFLALFFGWGIVRGESFIGGDVFFYTYPLRSAAWEMMRGGQLPLWTPLVLSGYPLLSMSQLGLGYPLTWGHLFLPARHAETIYILAPFLFAPAFTYAYLRQIGRSRMGALLAGLSFGYGGLMTNTYGMNAIPTNSLMWLPLLLIAIERARTGSLALSTAAAALVYAMSVLTGHGQSFLFVGLLALAYALFLSFTFETPGAENGGDDDSRRTSLSRQRWRPLLVCAGGGALGVGVAAFQILETMRAARRSIRSSLSYEFFVEGSFTPLAAWHSFIAPLYHYIEVTSHVVPLTFALALCAVAFVLLRRGKGEAAESVALSVALYAPVNRRVYFWAAIAVAALVLMLGDSTPLYRALYHVPIFNLFRRPSRHAFEWTFSLSVLAAYGWDALVLYGARRRDGRQGHGKIIAGTMFLLLAAATLGACWWRAAHSLPYVGDGVPRAQALYLYWKILFTLALVAAFYCALKTPARAWRERLLAGVVLLSCFVEPLILIRHWWPGTLKTIDRLSTPARTTRYLQQFDATANRVYVRAHSGVEEYSAAPRFDANNLTALYGLHNVAGYEQLLLERYSRALGGLDYDGVSPRRGFEPTLALFAPESHVLDLLNTTRVVAFANLATTPAPSPAESRLKPDYRTLDETRWRTEAEFEGVVILENRRALPRAWLVTEAAAVDGEEALRRIRGESSHHFDPRRTALLEVPPSELPSLPGGELSVESGARVTEYEGNRLVIETQADRATVLVVSENIYPGWEATIDGERARIETTNYLLRGVVLPAGAHRVEMRYTAPAARNGALISVASLFLIGGLIVYARRGKIREAGL